MAYTADILDSLVPITQFNRGQASRIFDRLHTENQLIVLKNNQPAAIILSPSEFQRLSEIEEDYTLLLEATRRLKEDSSSTSSREEVMSELGISEADLAAAGDVVMEWGGRLNIWKRLKRIWKSWIEVLRLSSSKELIR